MLLRSPAGATGMVEFKGGSDWSNHFVLASEDARGLTRINWDRIMDVIGLVLYAIHTVRIKGNGS